MAEARGKCGRDRQGGGPGARWGWGPQDVEEAI